MTTFTGTSGVDTADASGPTLTGFTTGGAADLTDANDDTFDCQDGADVVDAGTTDDTLIGGAGADDLNGGGGSDIYQFNNGDFVSGESLNDGGSTSDTDVIELIGNATVIDFRVGTVLNIEALLFNDLQTAQFDQIQLPTNLSVTGAVGTGQAIIVNMSTGAFTAGGWSFTDWGVNDKVNIVGRALGDTITGSSQDDFITALGGSDSVNGGEGADTYQYGSDSEVAGDAINDSGANGGFDKLFLFGNVDFTGASSITNIEAIGFDGANTATFNASQFGTGLITTDFLLTGANGTTQTIVVNGASNFSALGWSLGLTWEAADTVVINGTVGADTITGTNGTDDLNGGNGADTLRSGQGADTLDGEDGSDVYVYGSTAEAINDAISDTGATGKDSIRLLSDVSFISVTTLTGIEAFVFTGDQDFEINSFPIFGQNFEITGSNGTAQSFTVHNANGNFSVAGWTLKNWESSDHITLNGAGGTDEIIGSNKNDIINGLNDTDTLIGGLGKDTLTGGTEADTFDFNKTTETLKGVANRDVITDFSGVNVLAPDFDQIDLFTIDAKKGVAGNNTFKFIGAQKFHDRAGELQVKYNATTDIAIVSGDVNGDGRADFQIEVHSVEALAKADFIL